MKTLLIKVAYASYSYKLFNEPVSWSQASNACRIYTTSSLAKVTSKEATDLINEELSRSKKTQFWIEAFGPWHLVKRE